MFLSDEVIRCLIVNDILHPEFEIILHPEFETILV